MFNKQQRIIIEAYGTQKSAEDLARTLVGSETNPLTEAFRQMVEEHLAQARLDSEAEGVSDSDRLRACNRASALGDLLADLLERTKPQR